MENNKQLTYNNRSGSLCSILNCPVFHRHRSLSINELRIIMIEKPAFKAENPVINKSIHYCFLKVLIYMYVCTYIFLKGPPPLNFFYLETIQSIERLKSSTNFLNDFLCSTHFLIAVPLSLDWLKSIYCKQKKLFHFCW